MSRHFFFISFLVYLVCLSADGASQTSPFWTQTSGPEGGVITAIAVSNQGIIVAGGPLTGAYRSTDDGRTWVAARSGLLAGSHTLGLNSIAVNSRGVFFAASQGGFWRSQDGGLNWSVVGDPEAAPGPPVAIAPNGTIYGGGAAQVLRSSDDGRSWDRFTVDTGQPALRIQALWVEPSGQVYTGTDNGVYISSDRGKTWIQAGLEGKSVTSIGVSSNGDIFAGLDRGKGVYRLNKHSSEWECVLGPYQYAGYSFPAMIFSRSGDVFVGASQWGSGVWRSTDRGENWQQFLPGRGVFALAEKPNGNIFAGLFGNGVF